MNRKQILETAFQCVTMDRAATHGDAEQTFGLIAQLWSAYAQHPFSASDVAAMMGLMKIARLKGNPAHADSWIDLAGYAACGGELATGADQ